MTANAARRRFRFIVGLFIVGLVLSGITAYPLLHELELLAKWAGVPTGATPADATGPAWWLGTVRDGLRDVHTRYPWLPYGTDWLAFGHIVIAMFFIGPWRDPVGNAWVLKVGLAACAGVIVNALVCGPIRGIPFYWQLIDCSFGVIGALPLLYCLSLARHIRTTEGGPAQAAF
jgi:hypothetical protein